MTVASCTPHPDELYLPVGTQVQGYYVVTVGQEVGIFFQWLDAKVCVDGISGASHTRYDHWADALELYTSHYNMGLLRAVTTVGGLFWPVGTTHPTPPPSPTTTASSTNSKDLWSYLEDLSERAPLTQAEKALRALKAAQRKKSEKVLSDTISSFLDNQDKKMKDIGASHNVTEAHVKKLITYHMHYKKSRSPQLFNVLVHAKNQEVNGAMQKENLTEGEIKEYMAQLQEHRTLKTGGGHVNDQTPATWYVMDDATDFWEDVLDLMLNDIVRKFEQWACSQGKNIVEHDSLENMQKQVGRLILSSLHIFNSCTMAGQMTGKDNIGMNYPNYIKSIVLSYSIILNGWPATIPFTSPWNIHTVSEI
ncbi:hypothetical protein BDR05DRAFT_952775 [Suillus weaverae]|nr:hypothetical protein BDR05DRAFT_952775 [Suillus weaverae]